jgi:hypothetical protein
MIGIQAALKEVAVAVGNTWTIAFIYNPPAAGPLREQTGMA